jgi:phosphate uptake regulator
MPRLAREHVPELDMVDTRGRPEEAAPVEEFSREERNSVRILQRMGPVSLGVSVPRGWVEAYRLRVGSPVRLRIGFDGSLRVHPATGEAPDRAVRLDVERGRPPEHLLRSLLGAYLAGATAFEVHQAGGISPEVRGIVRTFVRRTIQPEVLSEERDRIDLQDVSDPNPGPLLKRLVRMGQMVVALHRDAGASWGALPLGGSSWESRDDDVDRQAWYLERSAMRLLDDRAGGELSADGSVGPLGCWLVARTLERIADHAVRMGELGAHLAPGKVLPRELVSVRQFHEQALQHLAAVLENLPGRSGARANELLDTGEALHLVTRTLTERLLPSSPAGGSLPPGTAYALGAVLESIDRTVAYAQDIAEVTLGFSTPLTVVPTGAPPGRRAVGRQRRSEERNTGERRT